MPVAQSTLWLARTPSIAHRNEDDAVHHNEEEESVMRKLIAVLIAAVAALGTVPVFAAEPINPVPALVQQVKQPTYPQPAEAVRSYTQWELHQAQTYRSAPGQYRESPGGGDSGAGAGAGDAGG